MSRLSGGVAVIQVGAQTETELKEKKLRVEDALNATKVCPDVQEARKFGDGSPFLLAYNVKPVRQGALVQALQELVVKHETKFISRRLQ